MTSPLLAGMPPQGWFMLFLVCAAIAAVGAFGLCHLRDRRHQRARRQFPLSIVAVLAGPLVGIILGTISYLFNRSVWEPIDLRRQFSAVMLFSTYAGFLVGIAMLLMVDLSKPRPHNKEQDSEHSASDNRD